MIKSVRCMGSSCIGGVVTSTYASGLTLKALNRFGWRAGEISVANTPHYSYDSNEPPTTNPIWWFLTDTEDTYMSQFFIKTFIAYALVLILSGCGMGPGYELKYVDGAYKCTYQENVNYLINDKYFEISDYENDKNKAQSACKSVQKKLKNKYRCLDYVEIDSLNKQSYIGIFFANRLYQQCIANDNDDCLKYYPFADCIAAKCTYKSQKIKYQKYKQEDWISYDDWSACTQQHL